MERETKTINPHGSAITPMNMKACLNPNGMFQVCGLDASSSRWVNRTTHKPWDREAQVIASLQEALRQRFFMELYVQNSELTLPISYGVKLRRSNSLKTKRMSRRSENAII